MKIPLLLACFLSCLASAEDSHVFTLRHKNGGIDEQSSYLSFNSQLRIAQLPVPERKGPLSAINVLDFAKNTLRILRPINQSYEDIPLAELDAAAPSPGAAPGIPPLPSGAGLPATGGNFPIPPEIGDKAGFATTEETKKILGFPCRKYLFSAGRLQLVAWATPAAGLPPFHLLREAGPGHFGVRDALEDWPRLLREQGLFPLHATLQEPERPAFRENRPPTPALALATWEITTLESRKLTTGEKALFTTPANYLDPTRQSEFRDENPGTHGK